MGEKYLSPTQGCAIIFFNPTIVIGFYSEESKTEESKTEESKTEESKTEESKTEESKTEESKTEELANS